MSKSGQDNHGSKLQRSGSFIEKRCKSPTLTSRDADTSIKPSLGSGSSKSSSDKKATKSQKKPKKKADDIFESEDIDNISVKTTGRYYASDRKSYVSKQPSTNTVAEGVRKGWNTFKGLFSSTSSETKSKEKDEKTVQKFEEQLTKIEQKVETGNSKVEELEQSMTYMTEHITQKVQNVEQKIDSVTVDVATKQLIDEKVLAETNKTLHTFVMSQKAVHAPSCGHSEYVYFLMFAGAAKCAAQKWRTFVKCMMTSYPETFVDSEIEYLRTRFKNDDRMKVQEFLWRWKLYFASQQQLMKVKQMIQAAIVTIEPKKFSKGFDWNNIIKQNESTSQNAACFTESYILYLAGQFPSEWKSVGFELGFQDDELKVLEMDNQKDIKNTIFNMLMSWKKKEGGSDHLMKGKLMIAFIKANRIDLAEKVGGQKMPVR